MCRHIARSIDTGGVLTFGYNGVPSERHDGLSIYDFAGLETVLLDHYRDWERLRLARKQPGVETSRPTVYLWATAGLCASVFRSRPACCRGLFNTIFLSAHELTFGAIIFRTKEMYA
jgi:hypothetical protein